MLIVEDEADALELIQWWIEGQGWEVRTAQRGQAAVEIGKTFKPDFLITDYFLQDDVNGIEVIEQLRTSDPNLHCVLVTGLLGNSLKRDVHRLQDVPILAKPFDFHRLEELISASSTP
jgi:DNA-binding response OmpR family regulator